MMMASSASGLPDDKGKGRLRLADDDKQLPWVEKYRPTALDSVLSQPDIIVTIKKFIADSRLPHLLLYGPPGTGKTSTANAICIELFGLKWKSTGSVLELNASDERGIDVVREQIKTFAETRGINALAATPHPFKVIILDEADAMTSAAQNALRRVMEKHVKHVRFIILCNYASQIIPALQSRCTKFRFSPLSDAALHQRLRQVMQAEGIEASSDAQQAIVKLAKGDMRRVLNVLQAAAAAVDAGAAIDGPLIYAVTATAHPGDIDALFSVLLQEPSLRMAVRKMEQVIQDNSMALNDLATALFDRVCAYQMPPAMRTGLLKALSDCEYRCASASGVSETVQQAALVGAFFQSRQI